MKVLAPRIMNLNVAPHKRVLICMWESSFGSTYNEYHGKNVILDFSMKAGNSFDDMYIQSYVYNLTFCVLQVGQT